MNPAKRVAHEIKIIDSYPLLMGAWPAMYHLRPSPRVWNRNPANNSQPRTLTNKEVPFLPFITMIISPISITRPIVAYMGKRRSNMPNL